MPSFLGVENNLLHPKLVKERRVNMWSRKRANHHWRMKLLCFWKISNKASTKKSQYLGWLSHIEPQFLSSNVLQRPSLRSSLGNSFEIFKWLQINIPFLDAISEMPSYAKFLMEILSNKQKLQKHAMVSLRRSVVQFFKTSSLPSLKIWVVFPY